MNNRYFLIGLALFLVFISSGCISESISNSKYISDDDKKLEWQEGCYYYGPRDVWICDNYQATKEFVQSIPSDYLISSDIDVVGIAHTTGNYVLVYAIPDIGAKVPFFEIYEPSEDSAHDLGSKEEVEELGITTTSYEMIIRLSDLDDDGSENENDASTSYVKNEEEEEEVEVTTENEGNWCPMNTSWKMANPTTGEEVSMIYTGTKEIDGVTMCVMEYKATNPEDEVAKVEYMFSEDSETFSWKSYYANGTLMSEMTMKNGKMTMVDETGQVTEFESN